MNGASQSRGNGVGARSGATALVVAAGVATAGYWLLHRRGTPISPDGWAYWQGAVSLLAGKGYTYFSEHPIVAWPPGYTAYLAAFTRVMGATVFSVAISNSILAIAGALGWTYVITRVAKEAGAAVTKTATLIVGIYVALFLVCNEQYPLADNLKYALLPWLVFSTWRLCNTTDQRAFALWTAAQAAIGTALVLTHNNAVAFVGAASVTLLVFGRIRVLLRILAAVVTSAVPATCWQSVRVLLDQEGSHLVGIGAGRESAALYLWQLLTGLGELLVPGPVALRVAATTLFVAAAIAALLRANSKRAWQIVGFFSLLAAGATYVLFNVTWIDDPLTGRYLLFIPVSLVPMILVSSGLANRFARFAVAVAVLLPMSITTVFAIQKSCGELRQLGYPDYFVPLDGWIARDYRRGPPIRTGKGLLLAPLQWEESKGRHRGLRDL